MLSSSTSSDRRVFVPDRRAVAAEREARVRPRVVRVLLVDDNAAMLARARAVLSPGCEVVGAVTNGTSALQAADALHPDVIVLDISMPGLSGLDVAFRLRKAGSTAAVVFLTVHDEAEFVVAAKDAGGLGYVVKSRLGVDLMQAVCDASDGRAFVSPILEH
jgi:DNA-binding NarL/FixJ family response regulator